MTSAFLYKVPLVCFVQVGGWFGFVLFFCFHCAWQKSRPFQLLNPSCTARSIPGKVHLLWETKTWGRQTGAAAQPCCPIPHPGESTSPLQGSTSLRTFLFHLSRKGKCHSLPRTAPSGSVLHSDHRTRGWALTPNHEEKCNCVFLSWGKTLRIPIAARIVSWRYFTVNLNGLGIVKLSRLF